MVDTFSDDGWALHEISDSQHPGLSHKMLTDIQSGIRRIIGETEC